MRTLRLTLTQGLAGAVIIGAGWTAMGVEARSQVAMARPTPSRGTTAVPAPPALAAKPMIEWPAWGQVSAANVNVRWGAGAQHGVVTILHGGDYVRVLGSEDGWLQIEWPNSTPAWIGSESVTPDGKVTGSRVRVRAAGLTVAPVLAELKRNERVEILESVGRWYKIKPPVDAKAYIAAKLVVVGVTPPAPQTAAAPTTDTGTSAGRSVGRAEEAGPATQQTENAASRPAERKPPAAVVAPPETVRVTQSEAAAKNAVLTPPTAVPSAPSALLTPTPKPAVEVRAVDTKSTGPVVPVKEATSPTVEAAPVVVQAPVEVQEPVRVTPPVQTNNAPKITSLQAGPLEQPEVQAKPSEPMDTPQLRPEDRPNAAPNQDRDLEDEDPDLKIHTPDQAVSPTPAQLTHQAMETFVEEVPTAALLKRSTTDPCFIVVPVEVRAAADEDDLGALLPPPRFIRDRAEAKEVQHAPATALLNSSTALRASAPLIFRLPEKTKEQSEFIFLNGKLQTVSDGPQGVRHRLVAGGRILFVRSAESGLNLDGFVDRQVEVLARCTPSPRELHVSALHPLD